MLETLALLGELLERPIEVEMKSKSPGDARETCADTYLAQVDLGFAPAVKLSEGLARELDWVSSARVGRRSAERVT